MLDDNLTRDYYPIAWVARPAGFTRAIPALAFQAFLLCSNFKFVPDKFVEP